MNIIQKSKHIFLLYALGVKGINFTVHTKKGKEDAMWWYW
jgi:hypothetical protein